MYVAGGVRKIRHYPRLIGAGAYGQFRPMEDFDIDVYSIIKGKSVANEGLY